MVGGLSGPLPVRVYSFTFTFMLRSFQYLGDDHTFISLVKGEPKVRVGHGEIVESELDAKIFTTNRFQDVTDGIPDTETKEDEKAPEVAFKTLADLSVAKLKEVAEKEKVELPRGANKATIVEELTKKLPEEKVAEVLTSANAENV